MSYKINYESFSNNFAIPSHILSNLKDVNSDYLKVILIIFYNPNKNYSSELLSALLDLEEKVVVNALNYWETQSLISFINNDNRATLVNNDDINIKKAKKPLLSSEVTILLKTLEEVFFMRPLSSTETNGITSLYESLNLPIDVVLMAFQYCMYIEKLSVPYAQRVCYDWMSKGINTHEKADEYLKTLSDKKTNENKLKTCFGIDNRNLTTVESEFVSKWFYDFMFDLEIIKYAFDKTVNAIGKVSFPYINKILESYYADGIKSIDEIESNVSFKQANASPSLDINEINKHWSNLPKF